MRLFIKLTEIQGEIERAIYVNVNHISYYTPLSPERTAVRLIHHGAVPILVAESADEIRKRIKGAAL